MIPSRHLANYSHLRPAQRRVLAGDRSEWTEDTEISAAKNMARYLDEASQQHYGSLQNNQPVSRHLIRTCHWCLRIVVAGVNRNTSAGEAEAEKEADAGADQRR